jgi:hypothetical protein
MSQRKLESPTVSRVGSISPRAARTEVDVRRARPLTRADLLDAQRFTTIEEWPVLDEHHHREKGNIDAPLLRLMASNTNARTAHGDHPKLWVGHTTDAPVSEGQQPPIIGYVSNLRVAPLDPWLERHGLAPHGDRRLCLFADYHVHKGKEPLLHEYPSRSVERVRSDDDPSYNFLDGVALLRKAPERPLPVMTYGRDWRPPSDAEVIRYERDLPPLSKRVGAPRIRLHPQTLVDFQRILAAELARRGLDRSLRHYCGEMLEKARARARGSSGRPVSREGCQPRVDRACTAGGTSAPRGPVDGSGRKVAPVRDSRVAGSAESKPGRATNIASRASGLSTGAREPLCRSSNSPQLRAICQRAVVTVWSYLSGRDASSRSTDSDRRHQVASGRVSTERYVKDPAFEQLHPRGQPANAGQFVRKGSPGALARRVSDRSEEPRPPRPEVARSPTKRTDASVPQPSTMGQARAPGALRDVPRHAATNMQSKLAGTARGGLHTSVKTDLGDRSQTRRQSPTDSVLSRPLVAPSLLAAQSIMLLAYNPQIPPDKSLGLPQDELDAKDSNIRRVDAPRWAREMAAEIRLGIGTLEGLGRGLKTSGKVLVNSTATAVRTTVTLGLVDGEVQVLRVSDEDRANGYDAASTTMRFSVDLLIAAGTGGLGKILSNGGKFAHQAGKGLILFDGAGNVVGVVKGAADAPNNGVNFGNGTRIVAGALGVGIAYVSYKGLNFSPDAGGAGGGGSGGGGRGARRPSPTPQTVLTSQEFEDAARRIFGGVSTGEVPTLKGLVEIDSVTGEFATQIKRILSSVGVRTFGGAIAKQFEKTLEYAKEHGLRVRYIITELVEESWIQGLLAKAKELGATSGANPITEIHFAIIDSRNGQLMRTFTRSIPQ